MRSSAPASIVQSPRPALYQAAGDPSPPSPAATPRGVSGGGAGASGSGAAPPSPRQGASRTSSIADRSVRGSPSGKQALEEAIKYKERRERLAREARLRKEKEEVLGCTFRPALDARSERLVERGAGAEKPALHEPRVRSSSVGYEDGSPNASLNSSGGLGGGGGGSARPSPAPSPRIDPVSRALANMAGRSGPVHERLLGSGEETSAKIAEMQEEKAAAEEADLSFKPSINPRSHQMHRDKDGQSAAERLTSGYAKKRADHFEKLKKEAEEKLSASIAQVKYMNESSRRILSTPGCSRSNSSLADVSQSSGVSTPRGFHTPRTGLTPHPSPLQRHVTPPPRPASRHYTPQPSPLASFHQTSADCADVPRLRPMSALAGGGSGGWQHGQDAGSPRSLNSSGAGGSPPTVASLGKSPRANSAGGGGVGDAHIAAEIEKMRVEFARIVKEKEAEAMKKIDSAQRAASMVDVGWKENQSLKGELQALRAERDRLRGERDRLRGERDQERGEAARATEAQRRLERDLSLALARAGELEGERDEARRRCEAMRGDLDSITAKGQAVVRLNGQLMAQVRELSGGRGEGQQQQALPAPPLFLSEDAIGSATPSPVSSPRKQQQGAGGGGGANGANGAGGLRSPGLRGRLAVRAGRVRGRPASDSEDSDDSSLSSLDDAGGR